MLLHGNVQLQMQILNHSIYWLFFFLNSFNSSNALNNLSLCARTPRALCSLSWTNSSNAFFFLTSLEFSYSCTITHLVHRDHPEVPPAHNNSFTMLSTSSGISDSGGDSCNTKTWASMASSSGICTWIFLATGVICSCNFFSISLPRSRQNIQVYTRTHESIML